jgi:hypothetical protein
LFLGGCSRLAFFLHAREEKSPLATVQPTTPYDPVIDMLGRATAIDTTDRFLLWIADVCRQCREEAPKTLH